MRKTLVFIPLILCAVLAGATILVYSKYQKTSQDYATLQTDEETTRLRYGQAINEIATIQDSLNSIVLGEEAQSLRSGALNETSRSDEALARISVIKAGLERTKQKVQELDEKLKKSGVQLAGLEKMLTRLRRNLAEKETQVAQLTEQVNGLQVTVAEQQTTIEDKRRELGTIYYTVGTKTDLRNAGVIVTRGGVLGIGKTVEPAGTLPESQFIALDTDAETVIHINANRAEVVSDQPVSSYTLTEIADGQFELRILDPASFRTVKHVVIMTA